jgi:hypothetical protein
MSRLAAAGDLGAIKKMGFAVLFANQHKPVAEEKHSNVLV